MLLFRIILEILISQLTWPQEAIIYTVLVSGLINPTTLMSQYSQIK